MLNHSPVIDKPDICGWMSCLGQALILRRCSWEDSVGFNALFPSFLRYDEHPRVPSSHHVEHWPKANIFDVLISPIALHGLSPLTILK